MSLVINFVQTLSILASFPQAYQSLQRQNVAHPQKEGNN